MPETNQAFTVFRAARHGRRRCPWKMGIISLMLMYRLQISDVRADLCR